MNSVKAVECAQLVDESTVSGGRVDEVGEFGGPFEGLEGLGC